MYIQVVLSTQKIKKIKEIIISEGIISWNVYFYMKLEVLFPPSARWCGALTVQTFEHVLSVKPQGKNS